MWDSFVDENALTFRFKHVYNWENDTLNKITVIVSALNQLGWLSYSLLAYNFDEFLVSFISSSRRRANKDGRK